MEEKSFLVVITLSSASKVFIVFGYSGLPGCTAAGVGGGAGDPFQSPCPACPSQEPRLLCASIDVGLPDLLCAGGRTNHGHLHVTETDSVSLQMLRREACMPTTRGVALTKLGMPVMTFDYVKNPTFASRIFRLCMDLAPKNPDDKADCIDYYMTISHSSKKI